MMSDHEVQMVKDNMSEFNVKFHGPKDSESRGHRHAASHAASHAARARPPPADAVANRRVFLRSHLSFHLLPLYPVCRSVATPVAGLPESRVWASCLVFAMTCHVTTSLPLYLSTKLSRLRVMPPATSRAV